MNIPCVDIPEGTSGDWRVQRFHVSESEASLHNIRCSFQAGMGRRTIKPGQYTKLTCQNHTVMSDTDAEKWDHYFAVQNATGAILINGLGIGMVLNACLLKPEVELAFVVEKNADVITLVAPHYRAKFGSRVEIIHDDALTFKPKSGIRFGRCWCRLFLAAIAHSGFSERRAL